MRTLSADLDVKNDVPPPFAEGIGELPQSGPRSSYVWGLDLVRFAAAVMVVFFHLSWKSNDPDIAFAAGWVGVEIFFVISGFVIMGSASGANVATFARKRVARLYPAAIVCAVINLAVLIPFSDLANHYGLAVSATPGTFIASLLLMKGPFLVGALWTLPVEIGFYVLIAALIPRGLIRRPARIASALILWNSVYLVPFCLSQYGFLPFTVPPLGYGLLNLTMLRHGCFFGVGILLWVTTRRGTSIGTYAMLLIGIVLCCGEIVARVAELRVEYAHAVDVVMLAISALATFLLAVLGMWLFSRLNDILQPSAATISFMRYLGLVTYRYI
jgi:exopolysaccharide production protein ExoZ